jgi:ribosomal-protein-alanine N-acetyltransferase
LAALHEQAFETPWTAQAFAELLRSPGVFALAARGEARLEGLILMRAIAGEAEVLTLAVTPNRRRTGLARALLDAALGLAAQMGAERVFLEVAHDNHAAMGLYARAGFTPTGRRRAYYARISGPAADALILSRTLHCGDA